MNKFLLILGLSSFAFVISSSPFEVGDRVLARWTDNWYSKGEVSSIGKGDIHIAFDDGDDILHNLEDLSAVIPDKPLSVDQIDFGQHVLVPFKKGVFQTWHYWKIGYIYEFTPDREKVTVSVDDDGHDDFNVEDTIYLLTELDSPHTVGARVFGRWENGDYYHGFVLSATSSTVFVRYDDGDEDTLRKDNPEAVVLDKLSCQSDISTGQRVIGFYSKSDRFYPGRVTEIEKIGQTCFEASYHVKFDDGDERLENALEIRIFP